MLVLTNLETDKIAHERELDRFFWLDLESPSDAELEETGRLLGLHPVALEDTREWEQRPKVDTYDNHLLLVFYSARLSAQGAARPLEVHVYVSGSFVLTVRRATCAVLETLHEDLEKEPIHDEGYLVYRILDTLTDAWFPVIEGVERSVDTLEDEVLLRARREHLPTIYRLRQDVRELWRLGQAQREVFRQASEAIESLAGLSQGTHAWFRDVVDHLTQVAGELSRQNDDLVALTSTYFNANADRLNAVATRLTVIGTIFVVATIVTGFFGQNFGWLVRHINSGTDFLIFGVGGLVVPIAIAGTILWVKRRDLF
ncbi:MAG TPA: magnesium transporter CorA family protein [Solirubrobacteraceae bacterium]|nr:magnesium transporter CorA family protein [Solirubrobacteraceae bacterium]